MSVLTQEYLKQRINYDPETGRMIWTDRAAGRIEPGTEVGWLMSGGYRATSLLGQTWYIHRLVWLYQYGKFPKGQIDHINGNRADNRIANLRDVLPSQNALNKRVWKSRKKHSKYKGVSYWTRNNKWLAYVERDGKRKYLGYYLNEVDAARAYNEVAKRLHGKYAVLNDVPAN